MLECANRRNWIQSRYAAVRIFVGDESNSLRIAKQEPSDNRGTRSGQRPLVKKAPYKIDSYPVHERKDDGLPFDSAKRKMQPRYWLVEGVVRMEVWFTFVGAFKFILWRSRVSDSRMAFEAKERI